MKRTAEDQLQKDREVDEETQEPPKGMNRADESVLAKRTIRAMPKRALAGIPASTSSSGIAGSTTDAPSAPKFSGFAGFGAQSSTFSFTPPAPSANHTSNSQQSPPSRTNPSHSNPPIVSSSASAATKTFASFLGAPAPAQPSTTIGTNEEPDQAAIKYYSSLRGLNVSFISAVSKAVDADPFLDVAELLERYRNLRINVQKEFDDKKIAEKDKPVTNHGFGLSNSAPKPMVSMPAPPSSFAGFAPPANSSSSSISVPKEDKVQKPSGFSFASPAMSTAPSSNSTTSSSPFIFGNPTFGTPSADQPSSLFGGSSAKSTTSLFGTTPPSSGLLFTPPKPAEPKESEQSKPNTGLGNPFGTADSILPSSSPFGGSGTFGSGTASKPNPFGGFGKPSGSIGNPVGFGFGTPPPTKAATDSDDDADPPSFASSSKAPPANVATPPAQTPSATPTPHEGTPDTEDGGDDAARFMPTTDHDVDGEGEEDEETSFSARVKVYKLSKTRDGWSSMGIGLLKLKIHKETEERRVLLRNSSTGKIVINFKVYPGLLVTQSKKSISFVGHDNGVSTTFRLVLKSDADAVDLKDAMEKDIAAVKAKSE